VIWWVGFALKGGDMINLLCGEDLMKLGIKSYEGWNITAFLDHLELCEQCSSSKESLIEDLNRTLSGD
jgi:hypothetical protein